MFLFCYILFIMFIMFENDLHSYKQTNFKIKLQIFVCLNCELVCWCGFIEKIFLRITRKTNFSRNICSYICILIKMFTLICILS